MRIWYQSSLSIGFEPVWAPYRESIEKRVKAVARPDTQVDIHGVTFVEARHARSSYVRYLNAGEVINNAIRAERDGYDAYCGGCSIDPGIFEIKDAINIPMAFLLESCLHLASMLTGKFSLIAFNRRTLTFAHQLIRQYGLEENFVPCDAMDMTPVDLTEGYKNPGPMIEAVKQATNKAIDGGAGMLVSTGSILSLVMLEHGIREIRGVPILDSVGTIIKVTEMMVDLRRIGAYARSKAGFSALPRQEQSRIRKAYGLE